MSSPFEWRLQDIERKADEALQLRYEMATLRSNVDYLEHTCRELRSEVDGLRAELQACSERIARLEVSDE